MISVESVTPVIERSLTLVEETGFRRMCQRLDPPFLEPVVSFLRPPLLSQALMRKACGLRAVCALRVLTYHNDWLGRKGSHVPMGSVQTHGCGYPS